MKIAILSGKGGTGKTTVTTNFGEIERNSLILDCDVEEPNDHLFIDIKGKKSENVYVKYPVIDKNRCINCGICAKFCNFHSILSSPKLTMVIPELCHSCEGCSIVCPKDAITYKNRDIGKIYQGDYGDGKKLKYGVLNSGEYSGVDIIKKLKIEIDKEFITFIDSPPGTACSTVTAIENVDYCVVVTEPTPFGLSDLTMVVELLRDMNINFGVIVNRAGIGDDKIYSYLKKEQIKHIGDIPFDKKIAKSYSKGGVISKESSEYRDLFNKLLNIVKGEVKL